MKQYQAQFLNKYGKWVHVPNGFYGDAVSSIEIAKEIIERHKENTHPLWCIGNTLKYRIVERDVTEWHDLSTEI